MKKQMSCFVCFGLAVVSLAGDAPGVTWSADGHGIRFRVKPEGKPADAPVSLFLAPTGRDFSYYRFTVGPKGADAAFYSENGNIQPDPYAPAWKHETGPDGAVEMAIPFTAFYMTRNADWKTKWLVSAVRQAEVPAKVASWTAVDGFPKRPDSDDIVIRAVSAQMEGPAEGGGFAGTVRVDVSAAQSGEYEVSVAGGGRKTVTLRNVTDKITLPCVYKATGRIPTHVTVKSAKTGAVAERDYPVVVEYRPIRVKFTVPQYRDNFYPGQCADLVRGVLTIPAGMKAELTLEGPGFPKRTAAQTGAGEFAFDTKGFTTGEAWLSVKAGEYEERFRIRNLPDTGHQMVWIENGHLVVNGKPVFRRNIYALGLTVGTTFAKRYAAEADTFRLTGAFDRTLDATPGAEQDRGEAKHDVRPSQALFDRIRKTYEANRDTDYGGWYICDEPECRHISPVYLRHVYEYLREIDPYHPAFTASRGGKTYVECADWLETHPYLNCGWDEKGRRVYGTHPREVVDFLDAFEAWDRPDKCIGFLPTCFSYRWSSSRNDYPTFDEYMAHVWAALIRGAKSLWPYAGHDLGDRPSLYHGCRYTFQQAEAYEKFLLLGKHTAYPRANDVDRATWTLGGETLDVSVDYKTMKTTIKAPRSCEKGLEPLKSVAARVAQEERERKGRDNQLRGRYDDIVFSTNMKANHGGGYYKLIDGTRDMLARYLSYSTNDFIELSFARFTPVFDRARVWGTGLDSLQVEIRKGGAWQTLTPVSAKTEGTMRELVFDKVYTTVKMRFVIPGIRNQRNDREVYELELPSVKDAEKYLRRKTAAAVVDEGIVWKWDGSNAENATKWDSSKWYAGDIVAPYRNGGFTMKNGGTRYCNVSTNANWLVLDIDAFRDKPNPGYRAWHANILDVSYLAGTVTYPQAGLYTIELPPQAKADRHAFSVRLYGMEIDFNSIALMKSPANRVILRGEKGKTDIGPGDEIRIGVTFAEPCEDVAAQFLFTPSTGEMQPFAVNGTSAVELKSLDGGVGRRWGATVKVKNCRKFGGRGVYLKVTPLGSSLTRPVFGNFQIPFVAERE